MRMAIVVAILSVGVVLVVSKASARGEDSGNRVVLVTNSVEFEIAKPLQVTLVWAGAQNDPGTSKVYPGQELATGAVNIENQSPIRYGALLRPEPLITADGSYPQLTLFYFLNGVEYSQYTPLLVEPGTTVQIQVKVLVAWGAQPAFFRGLNLVVDPGPPPTTEPCPAARGCELG